jgi:hypothetical protein
MKVNGCGVETHVVDLNREGRELRGILRYRHETRVEAKLTRGAGEGKSPARVLERARGYGMIL